MKKKLGLKSYPEFLETSKIEIYWPGDPACDIEASDLVAWAKSLCTEGLVEKPGEKLSPIICRRLTPRELPIVEKSTREDPRVGTVDACAMGLLRVGEDHVPKRRDHRGLDVVENATMEALLYHDDYRVMAPFYQILRAVYASLGIEIPDNPEIDNYLEKTSLGSVAGAVILARSFRAGRSAL